ncbi:hypothetical protein TNCV_1651911 [Trichonephila clavipes]|nr:hypothetical protein TNCV_1651911 [Trichonephila clavipes]
MIRIILMVKYYSRAQWLSGSVSRFLIIGPRFCPRTSSTPQRCWLAKTDHVIGTSAHAPQRSMVTYTEMGTVDLDPHGFLHH